MCVCNPYVKSPFCGLGDCIPPVQKEALYFGYEESSGHRLQRKGVWREPKKSDLPGFPWEINFLDTGKLKNGRHPDIADGHVFSTCGGNPLWIAFFWWDRSGDSRSNSNSGFYVRGFSWAEREAAFAYACAQWPAIVSRQRKPLALQAK